MYKSNSAYGKFVLGPGNFIIFDLNIDDIFFNRPKYNVEVGQVWQHRLYEDIRGQILKVDEPYEGNVELIVVKRDPYANHHWLMNSKFTFEKKEDLARTWDLYKDVVFGETCCKCGKYCPYENRQPNFKCYACKNNIP